MTIAGRRQDECSMDHQDLVLDEAGKPLRRRGTWPGLKSYREGERGRERRGGVVGGIEEGGRGGGEQYSEYSGKRKQAPLKHRKRSGSY